MSGPAADTGERCVFLSHASPDRPFVEEHVLPIVREHADDVFFSPEGIKGSELWQDTLRERIDASSLFLVVISRDAVDPDRYVRTEVLWWYDEHPDGAGVIPVLIDDTRAKHVGMKLIEKQHVDFRDPTSEAADELAEVLSEQRPAVPVLEKIRAAGFDPRVASSYLRWLAAVHSSVEVSIAGDRVRADLAGAPMPDRLIGEDSSDFGREQELELLERRADVLQEDDPELDESAAESRAISLHPLPMFLGPDARLDDLELADRERRTVGDVLARSWRPVILGDPGSGKTTVARRMTLDAAKRRLEGPAIPSHAERLPVLCRATRLAELLETEEGELEELAILAGWDGDGPRDVESSDPLPSDSLRTLARRETDGRRLLLIVDGLDEVPSREGRSLVVEAIRRFTERGGSALGTPRQSPGNQVVVTSRIVGYHATPLVGRLRFDHLLLGPLSRAGTEDLASFWLEALGRALALPEARRRELSDAMQALAASADGEGKLLANPFLLISAISGLASGQLIDASAHSRWLRSDLYDAAFADALARASARFPGIPAERAGATQMALAAEFHRRAPSGILDREALDGALVAAAAELGEELDAAEMRALVLDGFGLVTERGTDLFGFLHLSIGEHLAGRWLLRDEEAARRLEERLDDPRWVEPTRLALGHLSRQDPDRFDDLVTALLGGERGWLAAALLVSSVDDFARLGPSHVEEMVAVLSGGTHAGIDEAVRLLVDLLARLSAAASDGRPDDAVLEPLCDAIRSGDAVRAVIGARVARARGLRVPLVTTALFDAQEADGPETGWELTAALQDLLSSGADRGTDAVDFDAVLAETSEEDREALSGIGVTDAGRRGVRRRTSGRGRGRRRGLLPRERTPMRTALLAEPDLLEHVRSSVGWLRIMVCLYGGSDYSNIAEAKDEQAWLLAQLNDSAAAGWARRRAARRLDAEVVPQVLRSTRYAVRFEPELMATESPLTPALLEELRRGASAEEASDRLRDISLDVERGADERGDAIAGWLAAGIGETAPAAALGGLGDGADADEQALRRRIEWRLRRSVQMVGDTLSRVPVGQLVEAFDDGTGPEAKQVLPSVCALSRPRTGGFNRFADRRDYLLATVLGWNEDQAHNLAVVLDAAPATLVGKDGTTLAEMLSGLHRAPAARFAHRRGWILDTCGPWSAPVLGEALSNLAALPPYLLHLRSWLVARMAEPLLEAGYGEEAGALLLDSMTTDREASIIALEAMVGAGLDVGCDISHFSDWRSVQQSAIDEVDLPSPLAAAIRSARPRLLAAAAGRLPGEAEAPYAALRGVMRLAASDLVASTDALEAALNRIPDPLARVRALELAGELGVPTEGFADARAAALDGVGPGPDRLLAEVRRGRRLAGPHAGATVATAIERAEQIEDERERSEVLAAVREEAYADPRSRSAWSEAVASIRSSRNRSLARGYLAGELLRRESLGPDGPVDEEDTLDLGPDLGSMHSALGGEGIAVGLLAAVSRGTAARLHLAACLDALSRDVNERSADWLLSLAGIAVNAPAARFANKHGWAVDPRGLIPYGDPAHLGAQAGPVLAALPAELAFLDEALAFRLAVPESDLTLQWLSRFWDRPNADELAEGVLLRCAEADGEEGAAAYRELWRAWRAGDDQAGRNVLSAVLERAPFAGDPWLTARAMLLVPRCAPPLEQALDVMGDIEDPFERLNVLRLAAPEVSAAELDEETANVWAELCRRCRFARIDDYSPDQRLLYLASLQDVAGGQWLNDALRAELEGAESEFLPWIRWESVREGGLNRVAWSALTLGTLAGDGLEILEGEDEQDEARASDWQLLVAREMDVQDLVDRGTQERWRLTSAVARAVDSLLDAGRADEAAAVLSVIAAPRDPDVVGRWREAADLRVADRATLLAVEAGRLDVDAVASLPRLLADDDDLVRLRAALGLSVVARGAWGSPRFRFTECGPDVVAALVRAWSRAAREKPAVASELRWCLADLIVDSMDVLDQVLALLAEEPELRVAWLSFLSQVDPGTAPQLLRDTEALSDPELAALLASILFLARFPSRAGLSATDLEPIVEPVLDLAHSETRSDAVVAAAAAALGALLRDGGDLETIEELAYDEVDGVASAAILALASAASQRGDDELRDRVREDLRELAEKAHGMRAIAAIGGLARLGEAPERACVHLEPMMVVRGLLASFDRSGIGEPYYANVARCARFVLEPQHLSGRAGALHAKRLVAAVVDELATELPPLLAGWRSPEGAHGVEHAQTDRYLSAIRNAEDMAQLLREIALRQPAALRGGVAERPELAAHLAETVVRAPHWVLREAAISCVGVLGVGDVATCETLLAGVTDTQVVSDAALEACRWIESVDDAGFSRLREALGDPRAGTASMAALILVSLSRAGALGDEQRSRTVEAVRTAANETSPGRRVLVERNGKVHDEGSLVGHFVAALADLVAGESGGVRLREPAAALHLDLPAMQGGTVAVAISPAVLPPDPVEYQARALSRDAGTRLDEGVIAALRRLGARCGSGADVAGALASLAKERSSETERKRNGRNAAV